MRSRHVPAFRPDPQCHLSTRQVPRALRFCPLRFTPLIWTILITFLLLEYLPLSESASFGDTSSDPTHSRNMTDDEPSLNIPSLLTLAVVSYFVLRWFLNRDDNPAGGGRGRGRGNVVDPASVAQIAQMFPQMNTRDIMWDLQRNGGSVPATTERILTGRGLETVCAMKWHPSQSTAFSHRGGKDILAFCRAFTDDCL